MSRILTVTEICGEALGAIGAWPVTQSAPDGEQLRRAMTWFDLIMAEIAGSHELFHLIPDTVSFTITNGTRTYNLGAALGANLPPDGVQFATEAYCEDDGGNRWPIEIVTREKIENVPVPEITGRPEQIYIDRLPDPTATIYPTPASTDETVYSILLVVQRHAPNVSPSGVTGTNPISSVLHEFRQSWQRYLILRLSHDLGSGPIFKIGEQSLTRWQKEADKAFEQLQAFANREHDTEPPVCRSNEEYDA